MAENFNIENPEQPIYENELLKLIVLGGIKLEGLDRMRTTLKVELIDSSRPPVRHNLDLYNDTQLEKFIRKVAERLEIGTSVIAASLSELTAHLEHYRLTEIDKTKSPDIIRKELSKEEKETAIAFLKKKSLLSLTGELIGKSGVVGEEVNRLIMYVIMTSRKREYPLHVISLGASGTGKTHLQEKVSELMPEEDVVCITNLSENAIYYFGQRELPHKVIVVEDLDGAENALYPLREIMSKRKVSKTIARKDSKGQTRTMHLVVEGPVCVAGCTTKEQIYEDNANRSFLLYLDESEEQDKRIMEYQRAVSAGRIDKEAEQQTAAFLRNCQRVLEPIKVVNPYAEKLQLPQGIFKPRRTNNHYLQFIEAVTFYHQFQREQKVNRETGEVFIETTLEDIEEANNLLKGVLLRKSDNLTGACRNYLEKLKLYLLGEEQRSFTNRSMSGILRIPLTTIKRYHLDLYNNGYLKITKQEKHKGYEYEIVNYDEYKLLQSGIEKILEKSLEAITVSNRQADTNGHPDTNRKADTAQPSSPVVAQLGGGLSNKQRTSKKRGVAQKS